MKFLIDNALSPHVAELLRREGIDTAHVRESGSQHESDEFILNLAVAQDRIVVSADTDFGTILALRKETKPSVIILRLSQSRRPEQQAALLVKNMPKIATDLNQGSVVVFSDARIRVRRLPIG